MVDVATYLIDKYISWKIPDLVDKYLSQHQRHQEAESIKDL